MIGLSRIATSASAFAYIKVRYPAGSTCIATNGLRTLRAKNTSGLWIFEIPVGGEWIIRIERNGETKSKNINIAQGQSLEIYIYFFPDGYIPCDYITGDGIAYINPNYYVKANSKYITTVRYFNPYGGPAGWSPSLVEQGSKGWGIDNTGNQYLYRTYMFGSTVSWNPNISTAYSGKETITVENGKITIELENQEKFIKEFSGFSTINFSRPLFICADCRDGVPLMVMNGIAEMYDYQLYEGATLIKHLRPCIQISSTKTGMLDIVQDPPVFYGPAASGSFTAHNQI